MVTILHSLVHMIQVAGMVCAGFGLLSLLEGEYTKKLAKRISRIRTRPQEKDAERSRV
ncbi:MAG: hypothetical protein ACRD3P_02695 [Terriglobales bacterium]